MPDHTFVVPAHFDLTATLLWAISGALLAARRGYAILGVVTIALVSSTGGGLLRDIALQDGVPVVLRTPVYLELVGIAVLFVLFASVPLGRWRHFENLMVLVDAIGFGAYAVVGTTIACVFVFRMLAIRFDIKTYPMLVYREEQK